MMEMKRIWSLILILLLLASLILISAWLLPYDVVKSLIDLPIPDGELESYTLILHQKFLAGYQILGILSLILGLILVVWKSRSQEILKYFLNYIANLRQLWIKDIHNLSSHWKIRQSDYTHIYTLIVIIILGMGFRSLFMSRPMSHDEAYTFIAFVREGFITVISDYHLPNNHILHSIFVFISSKLLGADPWMLRMPSFIAGMFLIPTAYIAGRNYFNRNAGLLAAGLVSFYPSLILDSSHSRGYPLLALISLWVFILAMNNLRTKNWVFWILMSAAAGAGFYAVPSMIYAYAMLMVWLLVSYFSKDVSEEYQNRQFLHYLFISGFFTVFLAGLLFSPVFFKSGINSVINNPTIQNLKAKNYVDFMQILGGRSSTTWAIWNEGIPLFITILTLIGFVTSLMLNRKISKYKISPVVGILIGILPMIIIQRTVAWPRVWMFLLPFYFILTAGGLDHLLNLIPKNQNNKNPHYLVGLFLGVVFITTMIWANGNSQHLQILRGKPGDEQLAAEFLADYSTEEDMLIVVSPSQPAFWFYGLQNGIDLDNFDVLKTRDNFSRALIVVNLQQDQTVESVVLRRGGIETLVEPSLAELIYSKGVIAIYQIFPK